MTTTLLPNKNVFFHYYLLFMLLATSVAIAQPVSGCAGEGSTQVICNTSTNTINLFDFVSGESSGGMWTMNAYGFGGTFDDLAGTYTPDGLTNGVFHFYYSFNEDADCGTSSSTVTLVFVNGDSFDQSHGYSCQGDTQMFNLNYEISNTTAGLQQGGVWTRTNGTGGAFDPATGMFDCTAEATSSTFVYTVQSACGTHSCEYNVFRAGRPIPGAGTDGEVTVCEGSDEVINLYDIISDEENYNPTWTRISGEGGLFDPVAGTFTVTEGTTSSVFRYRMASGAGMCANDMSLATITVGTCAPANQSCDEQFWKANTASWCPAYSPGMTMLSVFSSAPNSVKNKTLMQVLNSKGGGPISLARQAVVALLNVCSDDVSYPAPYRNDTALLIATVNNTFENPSFMHALSGELMALNDMVCPLDGLGRETTSVVTAYPMPFSDKFTLKFNYAASADVKIEIFNSLGTLVMAKQFSYEPEHSESILLTPDFSVQRGSLYLVRTTTSEGSTVQKIFATK